MSTRPPMLAADHIRELTQGFTTYEHVTQPKQGKDGRWRPERRIHAVQHRSLLDQLEEAISGASARADEDSARGSFASKPAAHLEAIDVLARIDAEALDLAVDYDLEQPPRTVTRVKVRPLRERLLAISGRIGDKTHPKVQSWWVAARLATQWDLRPFQPAGAPCPDCYEVKSLRIDLASDLARCVECHQVWDGPGPVAILAAHVKWCTDHDVTKPRHWTHDQQGELVECTQCLAFRDGLTEVRMAKAQAERACSSTPRTEAS